MAAARLTSSAPSANFASSVRDSVEVRPARRVKSSSSVPEKTSRAWSSSPNDRAFADVTLPACQRQLARERAQERRLAGSVRAHDRGAVAEAKEEVDRAEPEAARLDDRAAQLCDRSGRWSRGEAQLQLPRRPRLLDHVEPLQMLLCLRDLSPQRVCPAPVSHRPTGARFALAS